MCASGLFSSLGCSQDYSTLLNWRERETARKKKQVKEIEKLNTVVFIIIIIIVFLLFLFSDVIHLGMKRRRRRKKSARKGNSEHSLRSENDYFLSMWMNSWLTKIQWWFELFSLKWLNLFDFHQKSVSLVFFFLLFHLMSNGNSNTFLLLDQHAAQDLLSKAKVCTKILVWSDRIFSIRFFITQMKRVGRKLEIDCNREKDKLFFVFFYTIEEYTHTRSTRRQMIIWLRNRRNRWPIGNEKIFLAFSITFYRW